MTVLDAGIATPDCISFAGIMFEEGVSRSGITNIEKTTTSRHQPFLEDCPSDPTGKIVGLENPVLLTLPSSFKTICLGRL